MSRAAIVLVGDELLTGTRVDTNGPWLARQLRELGVDVSEVRYVGDDAEQIADALLGCARRAARIFLTGGIGPTDDDVTRDGLARAAGRPLVENEDAWQIVDAKLRGRGREPGRGERRQALLPEGARVLVNEAGVAPGIRCDVGDATVFVFPGVPHELQMMFDSLRAEAEQWQAGTERATRTLWIAGIPESETAERIANIEELEGIDIASYPHTGELELVLYARGDGAAPRAAAAESAMRERLGAAVYDPVPGERIEHVVVRALTKRGASIATAESFTGGLLARMLTRVPGASAVFPIGWVTYAVEEKVARLGLDAALIAAHGVVSAETVAAMAEGALRTAGTDLALASTGAAGPDPIEEAGRSPVPPGRVCLALAQAGAETRILTLDLPFSRELVQRYAAVRAFDMVRRALARAAPPP